MASTNVAGRSVPPLQIAVCRAKTKPSAQRKSEKGVAVRLTAAQYRSFAVAAEAAGVPVSTWLRILGLREVAPNLARRANERDELVFSLGFDDARAALSRDEEVRPKCGRKNQAEEGEGSRQEVSDFLFVSSLGNSPTTAITRLYVLVGQQSGVGGYDSAHPKIRTVYLCRFLFALRILSSVCNKFETANFPVRFANVKTVPSALDGCHLPNAKRARVL